MSSTATPQCQSKTMAGSMKYFLIQDVKRLRSLSGILIAVSFTLGLYAASVSSWTTQVYSAYYAATVICVVWIAFFLLIFDKLLRTLFALMFPSSEGGALRAWLGTWALLGFGLLMFHPLASTVYWLVILGLCTLLWRASLALRIVLGLACLATASGLILSTPGLCSTEKVWHTLLSTSGDLSRWIDATSPLGELVGVKSVPGIHGVSVVLLVLIGVLLYAFGSDARRMRKRLNKFLGENGAPCPIPTPSQPDSQSRQSLRERLPKRTLFRMAPSSRNPKLVFATSPGASTRSLVLKAAVATQPPQSPALVGLHLELDLLLDPNAGDFQQALGARGKIRGDHKQPAPATHSHATSATGAPAIAPLALVAFGCGAISDYCRGIVCEIPWLFSSLSNLLFLLFLGVLPAILLIPALRNPPDAKKKPPKPGKPRPGQTDPDETGINQADTSNEDTEGGDSEEPAFSLNLFSESNADEDVEFRDPVRESDGYVKYVLPRYRNRDNMPDDKTGSFAWIKGFSNSIGFRTVSTSPFSLSDGRDIVGRALGAWMASQAEKHWSRCPNRKPLYHAFYRATDVMAIDQPTFLARMPWDHPGLIIIPRQWIGRFVYPPGCSLYDKRHVPCCIPHADVSIHLRDELFRAAKNLSDTRTWKRAKRQVHLCQKAVRNAWRLLPGAYESLQRILAEKMPQHYEARDEQTKGRLKEEVDAAWQLALPKPLSELIQVRLGDLVIEPWLSAKDWEIKAQAHQAQQEAARQWKRQREVLNLSVIEDMKSGKIAASVAALAELRRTMENELDEVLKTIEKSELPNAKSGIVRANAGRIGAKIRQRGQLFSAAMRSEISKIETCFQNISPGGPVPQPTEAANPPNS